MNVPEITPCSRRVTVSVAGCTNDGLVYVASIDPAIYDMNLWVHSGVQEKWHLLATLKLASAPEISHHHCLMSAALTHDKSCVDVFLEAEESIGYLFRFFISNPKENCIYKCIDEEKIRFVNGWIAFLIFLGGGLQLHWLGMDCLFVWATFNNDFPFHIWRIDMCKDSMAFTLTDLLVYEKEDPWRPGRVCADEDFLYVIGEPPGQIKQYVQHHDGTLQLCHETIFHFLDTDYRFAEVCAYPSASGRRLLIHVDKCCYMVEWKLQSMQQTFVFGGGQPFGAYDFGWHSNKICTASRAQFFWLKANGTIAQRCIGMPSLQYMCLRKLCETWPALKMCKDEKEAKKMGISYSVWNRFFKPLVKAEVS